MKDTEDDFDDISEKEDQSTLALIIIAAMCVAGIVIAQVMKPQAQATMSIEMPEPPAIEKNDSILVDTLVYNLYLLNNDSAALYFHNELTISTLTAIFSDTARVRDMKNRVVLIKPHIDSRHQAMVTALDQMNTHGLQRFALVKCREGEFERLRGQLESN